MHYLLSNWKQSNWISILPGCVALHTNQCGSDENFKSKYPPHSTARLMAIYSPPLLPGQHWNWNVQSEVCSCDALVVVYQGGCCGNFVCGGSTFYQAGCTLSITGLDWGSYYGYTHSATLVLPTSFYHSDHFFHQNSILHPSSSSIL